MQFYDLTSASVHAYAVFPDSHVSDYSQNLIHCAVESIMVDLIIRMK